MKRIRILKVFVILLGVMMMCLNYGSVQASEITSVFSGETLSRDTIGDMETLPRMTYARAIAKTLRITESGYKTNNGDNYWTLEDLSDGGLVDLYCLNIKKGFGSPNGYITDENRTANYSNQYDFNDLSDTDYTKYTELSTANRNKILWILNNSLTSQGDMSVFLNAVSKTVKLEDIKNSDKYNYVVNDLQNKLDDLYSESTAKQYSELTQLTFEDIKIIQQIVIWHYTNPGNIFDNTIENIWDKNGEISKQPGVANIDLDGYGTKIKSGELKQLKINAIYKYFIEGAESGNSETEIPTLTLSNEGVKISETDTDYRVGPFSLTGEKTELIKNITPIIDIEYKLLNNSKSEITDKDFTKVIGKDFYLGIPKEQVTSSRDINIKLKYTYNVNNSELLTDENNYDNIQPVGHVTTHGEYKEITTNATIELIDVVGTKTWVDNNNQDGIRPSEITVNLLANGTKVDSKTVTATNGWKFEFNKLLKYKDGKEMTYTITENKITGYTQEIKGYDITNTHIPATVEVTGRKTWNDNNNQDGKRPTSITVDLLANGNKVDSRTVIASNNWQYTFTDLPKYEDGEEIAYTIAEVTVPGYTTTINGYNITNTYSPEKTTVSGTKIWDDDNNRDGKRPESITVNLLENGTKVASKTVTQADSWKYSFTNLPRYKSGKEITYTITENAVDRYTTRIDGYNITNSHTPETRNVSGEKVWEDNNNQDGKRPESIIVNLLANGKKVDSKIVTSANDWEFEFTDVPKYESGTRITYTITEDEVEEYTSTIIGNVENGFKITNTHTPETIKVNGIKTWVDMNNQDGKRPTSITVNLLANGKKVDSRTVKSPWKYSFQELPKYEAGTEITYTIDEEEVTGYTKKVEGYNITNSYNPEKISISGTKTWEDNNDQDGVRPEEITIILYANRVEQDRRTVTASDNWQYTFSDLQKFKDGELITYTIDEEEVTGYTKTIEGYNITNKYNPGKVSKTVVKVWQDNNNSDELRPNEVSVELYKIENGQEKTVDTVRLSNSNNWTHTWNNLDEKFNGEKIVYGIKEITAIEGYTTTYSAQDYSNTNRISITNIHVPKDIGIQLQKVDEKGEIISSSEAEFNITGAQTLNSQTEQGILNLNPQKLIGNNFEYTYIIKENKAPIGYNKVSDELSVKISGTTKVQGPNYIIDNISITDKDGNNLDSTKISAQYNQELNKVIIKVVNNPIYNEYFVRLLKVKEDGTTAIEGSWFKVENGQPIQISKDGNEIDKGTLNNTNELNLSYKIEETTAPNGYIKIDGQKEIEIKAKVELKDNTYQLTEVNMLEEIEGISISEENNVITIKVKNEPIITGKYNVVLRKVDSNGNKLVGSKFKVNGTEHDLSTGEVTLYENQQITEDKVLNGINLTYMLEEIQVPVGYNGIENTEVNVKAQVQKIDNNYRLIRAILVDGEGNNITDENISIKLEGQSIVIEVKNTPIEVEKEFDLSLRKFITKINNETYSREPIVDTSTIESTGTATYKHSKQPIAVQKGDIVTYTIRVYNEGELDGYVEKITDYLPDHLLPIVAGTEGIDEEKYAEEIEFNLDWGWIVSEDGKSVTTLKTSEGSSEIYSLTTGYENVTDTKLDAYVPGSNKLDYIDVQIKCLVTDSAVGGEYLTNIAEITEAKDINDKKWDGLDSELANANTSNLSDYNNTEALGSNEESYIPGQEDDDDFEKLVVKEFDLSLRKFITKVNEKAYSRAPIVDTSKLGTIIDGKTITTATYNHSKKPVIVETSDVVTYVIRVYNEGTIAGYANEITDNIPEGLEFMPNSDINVSYRWTMLDKDGKETEDITKAVMIKTDYLSDRDSNNIIREAIEVEGVKTLSYKDVEVQFKVIAKAEKLKDNIIINEAGISADSDRDIDSVPNRDEKYDYVTGKNEDDIDYEPIKLQYFDLALRKFITKVNETNYNNRYPEVIYNEDGSIKYNHTKDPVLVTTGDIVTYTIRVYNEGEKAGYATEVIDNLPDGLEFLPENETNKRYGWELLDNQGNITDDITKAEKATTNILEEVVIDALVEEGQQKVLSYQDVEIAFKVVEPTTSDRILVNTAQIAEDSDEDIDSIPNNSVEAEDDLDKEYVRVEYFDLSLKKWVTQAKVTLDGKTTTTKTGFTEDSEGIAKVDIVAKKLKNTTVKFVYNIKVTNEGQLPGYAYEVKDYIPSGLKFVAEDNKDWKEAEDGTVVTDKLKDTLLNPGESATVEIVLTWKNSSTNLGIKTNYAEISEDSADDIDSTPNNNNLKEDDIDDAQVILSIKTAGATTYIGLVLISVAVLAGGIFSIKKYVLDK